MPHSLAKADNTADDMWMGAWDSWLEPILHSLNNLFI